MNRERITSRNHPSLRRLRDLRLRAERERSELFLIEGLRFVAQALERRARIQTLVVAPELLTHPFGRDLSRRVRRTGADCLEVSAEVFHSLAQTDQPQGIAAVTRQEWCPLTEARPDEGLCWVALSAIRSAGNLGSLVRSADAVGAAGLILLGEGADPYDPAAVRASMGSLFAVHFARATFHEFVAWKRRHGCLLVGSSPSAATDYQAVTYRRPVVLLMGEERKGLPEEQQALCDHLVRIPMTGRCDSLNLAVATSLLLYEVFNQQRACVDRRSPAGDDERHREE